jgi:hypothetical protein
VKRRGRGWGTALGLVILTSLASVVHLALLIFLPLALMLVALPPRRPWFVIVGVLGALLLLRGPVGDAALDFGRGWTLVLSGWFIVASVAMPANGFLRRGLLAVGAASATAAVLFALNPGSFAALDAAVRVNLGEGVDLALALWRRIGSEPSDALRETMRQRIELESLLYPAMVGIGSLSGLAVAWWAFRRLTAPERGALGPLREFRFGDGLVWVLIAGILLIALPLGGIALRAGSNLVAFMSLLYALRGLGIAIMLVGMPGPLAGIVAVLIAAVLAPVIMLVMFILGLTDTWLDFRKRWGKPTPTGS